MERSEGADLANSSDPPSNPSIQAEPECHREPPSPLPAQLTAADPRLTLDTFEAESYPAVVLEDSALKSALRPSVDATRHSPSDSPEEAAEDDTTPPETISILPAPPVAPRVPSVDSRQPTDQAAAGVPQDEYGSLSRKIPKFRSGPVSGEESAVSRNAIRVIRTPTAELQPRVIRSRSSKRRPYLRIAGYAPAFLGVFLLWSSYALLYKYRGVQSVVEEEVRTIRRHGGERAEGSREEGVGVLDAAVVEHERRREVEAKGAGEAGDEWFGTEEEVEAEKVSNGTWAATGEGSSFERMKERSAASAIAEGRGGDEEEGDEEEVGEEESDRGGEGGQLQSRRAAPKHLTLPPRRRTPTGVWVGPFDSLEEEVMGASRESRGRVTRLGAWEGASTKGGVACGMGVRQRHIVVVMHEASLTGAPLAMAEVAGRLLQCGARVLVVVLNKKGPLLQRMAERGFPLAQGKAEAAFPAAEAAHAVVVGSAACWQWVEAYCDSYPHRATRVVWWLMENRREYFDVAKQVMPRVGPLIFIAHSQAELWGEWCREEGLPAPNATVVSLSLNGYLSEATAASSDRQREALRAAVRESCGVRPSDLLLLMLSSVNPGKGQVYVLEALGHLLSEDARQQGEVKLLIGSMGSKANKEEYVARVEGLIERHAHLPTAVLWAQETTQVAALYAAADAYVMSAQGIGETFGRVSVEAMAFGLPVLATEGGGTAEVVVPNVTALMHPVGSHGVRPLTSHMRLLLEDQQLRAALGERGKQRVREMFGEEPMYERLGEVLRPVVERWEDAAHVSANSARWREYLKELIHTDREAGKKKRSRARSRSPTLQ